MSPLRYTSQVKDEKKRHYNSQRTRRSLTTAAIELFSKIGYDAATTRGIAKKAGVNESLIQRYFANKLGLFTCVVDECQKKFMGNLPYEPAESLEEELSLFFNYRMELVRKEQKLYRVILCRALLDKQVVGQMQNISQNGIPSLVDRLAVLQRKGKIRKDLDLPTASILVMGVSFSLAVWTHIFKKIEEEKSREVAKLASSVLAKGMA